MTIEAIEQALVERIAAALPKAIVEASPDDPDAYDGKGRNGAVLVRYGSGDYTRPSNPLVKDRTVDRQFTLFCGSRSLRARDGHHGSYGLLEAAREAVDGFSIPLERERLLVFLPIKEGFYAETNGVWWYALVVAGTHIYTKAG